MERVAGLSAKQKDCLRLVAQNMNSKQIARALQISEHTVDQRIRQSLRVLDVPDRFHAARALVAVEGRPSYQPLIYQSDDLAEPPISAIADPAAGSRRRRWLSSLFPPLGGTRHDLKPTEVLTTIVRLALILAGGCAALVVMGLWFMKLFV